MIITDALDHTNIACSIEPRWNGPDLPVPYGSRNLYTVGKNYSATEKECLAMMYATQYFPPFVRKFALFTHYRPLV